MEALRRWGRTEVQMRWNRTGPRPRAGQPEIHEAAGVAMAASPGIHLL